MKTYLARLMFNINIENGTDAHEFDEQIRIIESNSIQDALFKARKIGRTEEETFVNSNNKLITWKFIDVADLYPLQEIKDGEQLYSTSVKVTDSESYIGYIRRKSMEIQTKSLTFA